MKINKLSYTPTLLFSIVFSSIFYSIPLHESKNFNRTFFCDFKRKYSKNRKIPISKNFGMK